MYRYSKHRQTAAASRVVIWREKFLGMPDLDIMNCMRSQNNFQTTERCSKLIDEKIKMFFIHPKQETATWCLWGPWPAHLHCHTRPAPQPGLYKASSVGIQILWRHNLLSVLRHLKVNLLPQTSLWCEWSVSVCHSTARQWSLVTSGQAGCGNNRLDYLLLILHSQ